MKNNLKIRTLAFALFSFLTINAQDNKGKTYNYTVDNVKEQSEIIKTEFKTGDYKSIIKGSYGDIMRIIEINPDKSQPNEHVEIKMKMNPNSVTESETREITKFYADKPYFASNYMVTSYRGGHDFAKTNGYVVRREEGDGGYRLVFLNKKMFLLSSWDDKGKYNIVDILVPADAKTEKKKKKKKKRGFRSFFKKIKEGIKDPNNFVKGEKKDKYKKELQSYIDAALKKQLKLSKSSKAMEFERINKKSIKAHDIYLNNYNNFSAINDTGRTVFIYRGASNYGTRYKAGAKISLDCSGQFWYDFTGKRRFNRNSARFFHAVSGAKCGVGKPPLKLSKF